METKQMHYVREEFVFYDAKEACDKLFSLYEEHPNWWFIWSYFYSDGKIILCHDDDRTKQTEPTDTAWKEFAHWNPHGDKDHEKHYNTFQSYVENAQREN